MTDETPTQSDDTEAHLKHFHDPQEDVEAHRNLEPQKDVDMRWHGAAPKDDTEAHVKHFHEPQEDVKAHRNLDPQKDVDMRWHGEAPKEDVEAHRNLGPEEEPGDPGYRI